MSNYKQTTVAGESWVQAKRIVIENPLSEDNTVKFIEEKVVVLEDGTVTTPYGVLNISVDNNNNIMTEEIEILDPISNEPTGTFISYGELHAIIFSTYMKLVNERDAQPPDAIDPIDGTGGVA